MSRSRRRKGRSRSTPARRRPQAAAKPPPAVPVRPEARAAVDVPLIMRGMSVGFSVLVTGELIALALARWAPWPASLLLALTGAAGAVVAAFVAARSGPPALQGALAAVGAYLLTVPLRFLAGSVNPLRIVVDFSFALVVGWVAGARLGKARDAPPGPAKRAKRR